MKIFLKDIKEKIKDIEILNYSEEISFSKFCHDTRELEKESLYIPISGDNTDGHRYIAEAFSKGSTVSLCDKKKIEYISDCTFPVIISGDVLKTLGDILRIYTEELKKTAKIIAITGSTGKTTTRELLSSVLSENGKVLHSERNFNTLWGNAELLDDYTDEKYIVLEFGMDKAGEIKAQCEAIMPDAGIILNIGFVHAGPLGGIERIFEEKSNLAKSLNRENGILALNIDDERLRTIIPDFRGRLITFGEDKEAEIRILESSISDKGTDIKTEFNGNVYEFVLGVFGKGYAYNACAAFCIGIEMGLSPEEIVKGLEKYRGFEGRFQLVHIAENVDMVNDAYNANSTSMSMSIDTFNELFKDKYDDMILILGDMKELGEYTETEHRKIGEMVKDLGFKSEDVYFLGEYHKFFNYGIHINSVDEAKEVMDKYIESRKKTIFLVKGSHGSGLYKLSELFTPSNISS